MKKAIEIEEYKHVMTLIDKALDLLVEAENICNDLHEQAHRNEIDVQPYTFRRRSVYIMHARVNLQRVEERDEELKKRNPCKNDN